MGAITPINKKKIVKKRTLKFNRFQSDTFMRVDSSWRKPKGIDGGQRRRFRGYPLMPSIGYGSDKKTRNLLPNGFYKYLVKTADELDLLMMHNRKYCAEIAKSVSKKKREEIVAKAESYGIRVTNAGARFRATEDN